jgi:plastocyanin
MRGFRTLVVGAGTSLVLVLSACGNGPPADLTGSGGSGGGGGGTAALSAVTSGPAASTVKLTDDLKFDPSSATAKVGDVVEWTNTGTTPHNVTFDSPAVASSTMNGGDTFFVKFAKAGTYHYVCTFHAPGMAGTITVS